MSEGTVAPPSPRLRPQTGLIFWLISLVLVTAYTLYPSAHEMWPDYFHPIFWIFQFGLFAAGLLVFLSPLLPEHVWNRVNVFSRYRIYIPREGIGYLLIMVVLFIGSSLTRSNTLLLVFAAMAGPFIVNGSITYTMLKNVRITRRTPVRGMVGELLSVEVDLQNTMPIMSTWMMSVRDEIAFDSDRWFPAILFTRVPPHSTQTGHYQVRFMHRGRHRFGPLHLASRFPLGLVERGMTVRETGEMLIYPRIGRLSPRWKQQLVGASELIETPQPRLGVFEDEYHHLREYRPGDNPRAIHWRSSARRNALIVREYQQNREHHMLVVIDLAETSPGRSSSDPRIEQVLSVSATLCAEHRRECRGAFLTVLGCGRQPWRWEARANSTGLETLFDKLAVMEPIREPPTSRMLIETLSQMSGSTRVVVVSTRDQNAAMTAGAMTAGDEFRRTASLQWLAIDDARFADLIWFADDRRHAAPVTDAQPVAVAAANPI